MMKIYDRLFETDRNQQPDRDGRNVDAKLSPSMNVLVRWMYLYHDSKALLGLYRIFRSNPVIHCVLADDCRGSRIFLNCKRAQIYFFVVTRVTVKISLGRTWPSGLPGPSCEMMRDLKIFSVSSMISSTAVESEDSPLNRQVVINRPCSIRHFPRELSPSSGGSIIQVASARY